MHQLAARPTAPSRPFRRLGSTAATVPTPIVHTRLAALTLAGLAALAAVIGPPTRELELALAAAAILLLGVPHGAADVLLWPQDGRARRALRVGGYVAAATLLALVWAALPGTFLAVFFLASAWHFGDGDVAALPSGRLPTALEVAARGALPLAVPLLAHREAALVAIAPLLPGFDDRALAIWTSVATLLLAVPPMLAIAVLAATARRATRPGGAPREVLAEAAAITAVGVALPPLASFAAVFTLVHSARHLLRVDAATALPSGRRGALWIAVTAAAAIAGGAVCWWLAVRTTPSSGATALLRTLFIGLAALTAPHAFTVVRALGRAGRPACRTQSAGAPSTR